LLGVPLATTANASPPTDASPTGACVREASGAVSDAFKLEFCTDLVQDLSEIGQRLNMTVIQPTNSFTSPVQVIFALSASGDTSLRTAPFIPGSHVAGGLIDWEPCQITVLPAALRSARLQVLIAHEVVHCYQNVVRIRFDPDVGASSAYPDWVSDGSATYLATLYAHSNEDNTSGAWLRWIGQSDTLDPGTNHTFDETSSLTHRGYDAIGWYSLVAQETGDPLWSKMAGAWLTYLKSGPAAYIASLGGDSPGVAKAWAPSVLNKPTWGDDWTTPHSAGVIVPGNLQPTKLSGLTAGRDFDTEQIAPLAAIVDNESDTSVFTNALIEVSVSDGYASVHDATGYSDIGFQDEFFCFGTACKLTAVSCPQAKAPLKPIELRAPFTVAAGGGVNAATYEIAKISQPATPNTPLVVPASDGRCLPHLPAGSPRPQAGFSEGDPHLETLNGVAYDFQAAGEFTLVRSDNGEVQVQVRQVPFSSKYAAPVSHTSAVAMRVDTSTIEVDQDQSLSPVIFLDRKQVTLPKGSARQLPGGGRLSRNEGYVTVAWPDGSRADVFEDLFGEDVTFTPPPAGVDHFVGLLTAVSRPTTTKGRQTGQETLSGGNGHRYVLGPSTKTDFKILYGAFANSWRVTQKTSLFTYRKGESTASYNVKGFPAKEATVAGLPLSKKVRAQRLCNAARITNTKLLNDCVLDVGITGITELASSTARVQNAVAAPIAPAHRTGSAPVAPVGSSHPVTYYFTHPCEVITQAEIKQALGQAYPDSVVPPNCVIDTNPEDGINFVQVSLDQFKAENPGSVGSGPLSLLGHEAYCTVKPILAPLQSYVALSIGSGRILLITASNCTDATALARDVLAHISRP
jgi:hypothetical protein